MMTLQDSHEKENALDKLREHFSKWIYEGYWGSIQVKMQNGKVVNIEDGRAFFYCVRPARQLSERFGHALDRKEGESLTGWFSLMRAAVRTRAESQSTGSNSDE